MRFLSTCVLISLLVGPAFAIDLRTALELGVSASPELKQAKSVKKESEATAWQYKSEVFPTILGVGTAERKQNSNATRGFTSSGSASDPYSNYTAALQFEQPVFTGLGLISGWKLANVVNDKANVQFYTNQQTIVKNLILSYYSYAEAQEIFKASQGNLTTLQDYSKTLSYYARIGRGREMDRLQASVNASVAAVNLKNVEQDRLVAELNLKKLINWTSAESLTLSSSLHVSKHNSQKTQELTDASVETLLNRAVKNNPNLKVLEKAVDESKYTSDVLLATDMPSLKIVGAYGTQAIHREDMFQNNAEFYSYGLSLSIPLFSGLSSIGKRRELREQTFQAEKSFEIEKRELRVKIIAAQTNLKKSFQQYQDVKDIATRSSRALDLATRSHKQGTTSSQDVVSFQRSRYEAEQILIQNQYAYLRSLVELQELLGVDLYKTYTGAL